MGFGGISIWSLLLVLVIVVLLFGTKKLRNVGGDLGGAIKNFKKSVKEEEAENVAKASDNASIIEGSALKALEGDPDAVQGIKDLMDAVDTEIPDPATFDILPHL